MPPFPLIPHFAHSRGTQLGRSTPSAFALTLGHVTLRLLSYQNVLIPRGKSTSCHLTGPSIELHSSPFQCSCSWRAIPAPSHTDHRVATHNAPFPRYFSVQQCGVRRLTSQHRALDLKRQQEGCWKPWQDTYICGLPLAFLCQSVHFRRIVSS